MGEVLPHLKKDQNHLKKKANTPLTMTIDLVSFPLRDQVNVTPEPGLAGFGILDPAR